MWNNTSYLLWNWLFIILSVSLVCFERYKKVEVPRFLVTNYETVNLCTKSLSVLVVDSDRSTPWHGVLNFAGWCGYCSSHKQLQAIISLYTVPVQCTTRQRHILFGQFVVKTFYDLLMTEIETRRRDWC